jgi:predicted glycogen debranching enzyme
MDAKVGDWVVTPRIGKPVEVQALWLNALRIGAGISKRWNEIYDRGVASFRSRFWNEAGGFLYDVVDVDHVSGRIDDTFRPNQIFAVGGLPFPVLEGEQARRVVDEVERRLLTPLGLRSLAPGAPEYAPRYEGGPRERDGSYHQGTVWPWLMGPFVDAYFTAFGRTEETLEICRNLLRGLQQESSRSGCLGSIAEIYDADEPRYPRGCPAQAWSVAEIARVRGAYGL